MCLVDRQIGLSSPHVGTTAKKDDSYAGKKTADKSTPVLKMDDSYVLPADAPIGAFVQ